jgi:hypothetical protein
MSEDILCHIITILQNQLSAFTSSRHHLNILKANKFWSVILCADGYVEKLNSHPFIKRVRESISELGLLFVEKRINIQLLQQLFEYFDYSDKKIFRHFCVAGNKSFLGDIIVFRDVIVTRDEIAKIRKLYGEYRLRLVTLLSFYTGFCPVAQVTGVNDYIQDIKQRTVNLDNVEVKQALAPDYLALHEKTLESAKRCFKFRQSQSFRNIFESCIKEDVAATKVEYIAQKLIPIVFDRYNALCKQLEEWEKLKCSEAYLLWKNVTDVNSELDLMEGCEIDKSERLLKTFDNFSKWIERLEKLEKVMEIFGVQHNDDWLSKSIRNLKDDSMELEKTNDLFDYLDKNLIKFNQDCWNLVKELSHADEFIGILKKISKHDIKIFFNDVNDYSDEKLIQFSLLDQVNQFLYFLLNKNTETITDFLGELLHIIEKDHTLGEKIALCNSNNAMFQNMYNNIRNRDEDTKEKIKNVVLNGTYTFTRDEGEGKCLVSLEYPSKSVVKYNLNEILDLRRRALLIEESTKNDVDEFVRQVDIVQEIIKTASMLMQIGHLGYRKFEKKLQGTNDMKNYRNFLIDELEKW